MVQMGRGFPSFLTIHTERKWSFATNDKFVITQFLDALYFFFGSKSLKA